MRLTEITKRSRKKRFFLEMDFSYIKLDYQDRNLFPNLKACHGLLASQLLMKMLNTSNLLTFTWPFDFSI